MPMSSIPLVEFAIICGSANWGLRFPEDLNEPGVKVLERDMEFETPWGKTSEWKLLEFAPSMCADGQARQVLSVYSHGWPLDVVDHGAQRRVFWVLQKAGVRKVLASSTAGALNRGIFERDFVIASDILELTQTPYSLLPGRVTYDCSGKQMICPECADIVERTARTLWPAEARVYGRSAGLVAAHAWGPRLTTGAEAAAYRTLGADITNHSLAPEATLAREIGACFVNCTFITAAYRNYFSPPETNVLGEGVLESLAPIASRVSLHAVAGFSRDSKCLCSGLRSLQPRSHAEKR